MAVASSLDGLRTRLAAYATATVVGIVLSVVSDATFGGVVTLGAVTMLVLTLHRYGRSGPD